MAEIMKFDEATSRRVEASYATPDVVEQRRVVREALAPALTEGWEVDNLSDAGEYVLTLPRVYRR